MSNYTKLVNFAAKDSLPSGDAGKLIKGTEINTELNNIQTAVNTKADSASPALTGTPTAPTAAAGTNTTQIATTAYVYNLVGGLTATPAELNVLDGITATTAELNVLDGITATTAELNYVDGVTSNIQTQIDTKAPLASPSLTGVPTAPTASAGTNTTQVATTAFVGTAVSNLVDSAPSTLDTLNELAAALGDDPNFATTVTNSIAAKLDATYRELPQVAKDATYTFVASDSGKHIYHSNGTAYTWTIPPNSSVAFPIGTVITVVNDASAAVNITIARGTGVALLLSGTDQNCTVGQYGIATLLKVGTDRWLINGSEVA